MSNKSRKALPSLSPLLKREEAAQVLGISLRALDAMEARGLIPAVRMPKAVRYSPDALREFIARGGTHPRATA